MIQTCHQAYQCAVSLGLRLCYQLIYGLFGDQTNKIVAALTQTLSRHAFPFQNNGRERLKSRDFEHFCICSANSAVPPRLTKGRMSHGPACSFETHAFVEDRREMARRACALRTTPIRSFPQQSSILCKATFQTIEATRNTQLPAQVPVDNRDAPTTVWAIPTRRGRSRALVSSSAKLVQHDG